MKTKRYLFVTMLSLTAAVGLLAAKKTGAANALADVQFLEPAKFTDVRDDDMGDYERTTYLDQLRDHILAQAKYFVPPGQKLSVTFTDIDMAGDFEPWRGPRFSDIRIVRDIYPPRVKLAFQLVDAGGNVLKRGERELRDMAFMMKIAMGFRDDPVRHEKALIDDWMRSEFPRVRRS